MACSVRSTQITRAKPAHGRHGAPGTGGEAVKRKPPTRQRRHGGGWKESPLRPLTAEGKKRGAQWLRAWNLYMNQLLFAEAERR